MDDLLGAMANCTVLKADGLVEQFFSFCDHGK
jgi:hypothetical protein